MIPAPPCIVAVSEVLPSLGFVTDLNGYSENPPAFKFCRGNLELTAGEMTNIHLRSGMHFFGHWQTARSLKIIAFEMPLKVASYEQVIAWIAHGIGVDYVPPSEIDWFEEGKRSQGTLPWQQHYRELRERSLDTARLRALRPHCFVARKWARILLNHMEASKRDHPRPLQVRVHFNGRMLTLEAGDEVIGAPAQGKEPWAEPFSVALTADQVLPKRLLTDPVEIGIWEGALEIERCKLPAM